MASYTLTYNHLDNVPMKIAPADHPVEFRLYDDDDVLYFSGRMSLELYGSHNILHPLDDSEASWGCTRLECRNARTREWEDI